MAKKKIYDKEERALRSHDCVSHYNKRFAGGFRYKPLKEVPEANVSDFLKKLRWPEMAGYKIEVAVPAYKGVFVFHFPDCPIRFLLFDPLTGNEHWCNDKFDDIHFNKAKGFFGARNLIKTHLNKIEEAAKLAAILQEAGVEINPNYLRDPVGCTERYFAKILTELFDRMDALPPEKMDDFDPVKEMEKINAEEMLRGKGDYGDYLDPMEE